MVLKTIPGKPDEWNMFIIGIQWGPMVNGDQRPGATVGQREQKLGEGNLH